eukprot:gene4788-5973_t
MGLSDKFNHKNSFINNFINKSLYLDLRSLALFRVLLSLCLIFDLFARSVYLMEHYTIYGLYPGSSSLHNGKFSFHLFNGSTYFQVLLFLIHGVFYSCMLVGYRTRLYTLLSYIMLVSLQNRNHYLLDGSDDYSRVLLFFSIFVPTAEYFSIDSLQINPLSSTKDPSNPDNNEVLDIQIEGSSSTISSPSLSSPSLSSSSVSSSPLLLPLEKSVLSSKDDHQPSNKPTSFFSMGTLAIYFQFSLIYWFTAYLKSGDTWHKLYSSVYYAINLKEFSYGISDILSQYPSILIFLCRVCKL